MDITAVNLVYVSPTHTTQAIVRAVGEGTGLPIHEFNATHLTKPPATPSFTAHELVVIGLPVYMGRVPFRAGEFLASLHGAGTPVVLIGVYGNRAFDDFLVELEDIVRERGFLPIAAGAFLGEHSITSRLATGRPDRADLEEAAEFGRAALGKLLTSTEVQPLPPGAIPGHRPYETYSASRSGKPATEKLANGPTVNENCTNCKLCVAVCPIDNINPNDVRDINPFECLRCHACVRSCPVGAIAFLKPGFVRHVQDLEEKFVSPRKTPTIIL